MPFTVAASQYYDGAAAPSPAYSGTFIPTLWSSKLIEKFYNTTVLNVMANTDYEGEIKSQGDQVNIRTRPTLTINDYQAGQELAVQRPTSNIVSLNIDKGKYWNAIVDDVMETQSDINMMNIWAEDASEQMKIQIDTDVLGNIAVDVDASNQGNIAGAISGSLQLGVAAAGAGTTATQILATGGGDGSTSIRNAVDFIVDLNQALDEQNIPETGRYVILPAWFCNRIKTGELKDASIAGDSTSILRNGRVGMIDRTTVYVSNLLPRDNLEWTVFAGHQHGLTFASQVTKTETIRAERTFGHMMRGLQVYGYKVVDGTGLAVGIVKQ
jgi:hypothetical protein